MATGIVLAVGSVGFEAALLEAVEAADLLLVRRCVDVPDLIVTAAGRQAAVVLLSAQLRGLDVELVQRLRDEQLQVVGVTASAESADEAALRRVGVDRIVTADDLAELGDTVREAQTRPAKRHGPTVTGQQRHTLATASRGRLVAVWGPTGAPGRTLVALGLAGALADCGTTTLVVDADVYGGTVAASLGMLDEASGLLAAARSANTGALDADVLAGHARALSPTLRVLTGLPRADRWNEVRAVLLQRVLEAARSLVECSVVDCGFSLELDEELSYDTTAPRRNGATLAAIGAADVVVLVGGADPVSLGRLVRAAAEVTAAVPGTAPYIVVNRVRSRLGWSEAEVTALVTKATGSAFVRTLPDDPGACDRALVHGQLVTDASPDSRLVRALRDVAQELVGDGPASARKRSRLRGRRARAR